MAAALVLFVVDRGQIQEEIGICNGERKIFFIKMLAEWENVCIFVVEKS